MQMTIIYINKFLQTIRRFIIFILDQYSPKRDTSAVFRTETNIWTYRFVNIIFRYPLSALSIFYVSVSFVATTYKYYYYSTYGINIFNYLSVENILFAFGELIYRGDRSISSIESDVYETLFPNLLLIIIGFIILDFIIYYMQNHSIYRILLRSFFLKFPIIDYTIFRITLFERYTIKIFYIIRFVVIMFLIYVMWKSVFVFGLADSTNSRLRIVDDCSCRIEVKTKDGNYEPKSELWLLGRLGDYLVVYEYTEEFEKTGERVCSVPGIERFQNRKDWERNIINKSIDIIKQENIVSIKRSGIYCR
ncbi:hypothetical protein SAMN05216241_101241 [Limimonas halophila]|uniref:Uncharacterized protein n=1 Tax=Limimonas halophila TaxID=1082479 RepID=A0A1G7LGD4_9PROT|nr:hypothetical protein SAMN05216241_101241 [Limimonas halophila]